MTTGGDQHKPATFWGKYKAWLLSLVLSVFSLPMVYSVAPNLELDGSWTRALNMAVKNHLVFGTQFVFTYGPLGFLSTRNIQYINSYLLLAGDLFLLAGVFYFMYQHVSRSKGWFFIVLVAMFFFRGVNYSQNLFLVFVVFCTLNFKNVFSRYFELIYCVAAGVLLFFIKINYGIISMMILPAMAVFMLFKDRKALAVFLLSGLVVFLLIYCNVHINLVSYVKNSIPLIQYYDESMCLAIVPGDMAFNSAMVFIGVFLTFVAFYTRRRVQGKKLNAGSLAVVSLLSVACYLFYKNGYTRYDALHYVYFLSVFPLFLVFAVFLLGSDKPLITKIAVIAVLIISGSNYLSAQFTNNTFDFWADAAYASPVKYLSEIAAPYKDDAHPEIMLPEKELKYIGKSTIDIIPVQIVVLQFNRLNYSPRPVPQTYSAYSASLDSLNANHFCGPGRPEFVLIKYDATDKRYAMWDESITKAALHLNYEDCNLINDDSTLSTSGKKVLLFKSNGRLSKYPAFEKISEQTIGLEDTVRISFADSVPVYMTADINYSLQGKLRKIFYQPPVLSVTLLTDSGKSDYEVVRPAMKAPVLVSKIVYTGSDLRNFLTGNLKANGNISALVFHGDKSCFAQQINITFLKFVNY